MTALLTAHICNEHNALVLNQTLASIRRFAPGARVVVADSASGWDVGSIAAPHGARVVRMRGDEGQLAALQLADTLPEFQQRLLFLQHSTPLRMCVAPLARACDGRMVSGVNSMAAPFWQRHALATQLLRALGVRNPGSMPVAEHCAIELTRKGWARARRLGLWAPAGSAPDEARTANGSGGGARSAGAAARPVLARLDLRTGSAQRELHQALEAVCGTLVSAANDWRPEHCSSAAHEALLRREHAESNYVAKVHGHTFRPGKESNCTVSDLS